MMTEQFIEVRFRFTIDHAPEFAALVAQLGGGGPITSNVTRPVAPPTNTWNAADEPQIIAEWGEDQLRQLGNDIAHNEVVRTLLDNAAKNPERPVSFQEACDETGMSAAAGRGQLQALAKLAKRMGKSTWPVVVRWAVDGKPRMYYIMPEQIAKLWRGIRGI